MQKVDKQITEWKETVESTDEFKAAKKFLDTLTIDLFQTIRALALNSSRANHIYDKQLTNRHFDDLIQSAACIKVLSEAGVQNFIKRELRYLLESTVKNLYVDQKKAGVSFEEKITYLDEEVPNSSISVAAELSLPFDEDTNQELISEIKSTYYELCAFVHPSSKQIELLMKDVGNGNYIGMESVKNHTDRNKLILRTYDILLTLHFVGHGKTMSGDLFGDIFLPNPDWKFHKGKYVSRYSSFFKTW
jgi:hypothetical protein